MQKQTSMTPKDGMAREVSFFRLALELVATFLGAGGGGPMRADVFGGFVIFVTFVGLATFVDLAGGRLSLELELELESDDSLLALFATGAFFGFLLASTLLTLALPAILFLAFSASASLLFSSRILFL